VSGANDRVNYYISAGYLDDTGIIPNSQFSRYSARANADYQAKSWLKVGASASFSTTTTRGPGGQTMADWGSTGNMFSAANMVAPIYPMYVRDAKGNIMYDEMGLIRYDFGSNDTNQARSYMRGSNPLAVIALDEDKTLTDQFIGRLFSNITLMPGLTVNGSISADVRTTRRTSLSNQFYGSSVATDGSVYVASTRLFGTNKQILVNYDKTFNDVHNLVALVGYETYGYVNQSLEGSNRYLYSPWVAELNNAIYEVPSVASSTGSYATQGILARAQYNYDGRYYVEGSYRRDASSVFAPGKRWGDFGSVSASWLINREKFMAGVTWVDMLKLKASYGIQGNDSLGPLYAYTDQFSVSNDGSGGYAITMSYKGNPDITWETSFNFNTGVEFNLFNYRLGGTIEYFHKKTVDMLYNKPVPVSLGYAGNIMPYNIAKMRNSGFEIDLQGTVLRTRNFEWVINANTTYVDNKILDLHPDIREDGEYGNTHIWMIGHSMYESFLPTYAGVNPDTGEAMYYKDPRNGDMTLTSNYAEALQDFQGDTLADFSGGFGTSISFYGVDISAQFAYQIGGRAYDFTYEQLMHSGGGGKMGNNWHMDMLKAWTPENRNTNVPRLNSLDDFNQKRSTRHLTSTDYLSLNNLTIGYTLPTKWTDAMKMSGVRIYFAGDNLFLKSARKGLDPRQTIARGDVTATAYSALKTFSGGISLSF
jgi:TonB-linked SusC/RagA family outer membrane protein